MPLNYRLFGEAWKVHLREVCGLLPAPCEEFRNVDQIDARVSLAGTSTLVLNAVNGEGSNRGGVEEADSHLSGQPE